MENKEDIEITLKNILLAGVGAVALSCEKSKEVFKELVEKGETAVEKGKVLNEELKHKIKDEIKDNVKVEVVKEELNSSDDILNAISKLSDEEISKLKQKIAEFDSEKGKDEK